MKLPIHDNIIYSYLVLCEDFPSSLYELVFYTEHWNNNSKTPEYVDIIFSGVIAHHFEQEAAQTVLFEIEEQSLQNSYKQNEALFSRLKNYSWPLKYENEKELFKVFEGRNIKSFRVEASCGLNGWIWAKEMRLERRESRKKFS